MTITPLIPGQVVTIVDAESALSQSNNPYIVDG